MKKKTQKITKEREVKEMKGMLSKNKRNNTNRPCRYNRTKLLVPRNGRNEEKN